MRPTLLFILGLLCIQVHAFRPGYSGNGIMYLQGGVVNLRPFQLNDYLRSQKAGGEFQYLTCAGIGFNSETGIARPDKSLDAHWGFNYFIRQRIDFGTVVPSSMEITGWELNTSLFGFDFLAPRWIDLTAAPGVSWGSLRMKYADWNESYHFRNIFIAPNIRAELRLNIAFLTIGARWSYRWDVTGSAWRGIEKSNTIYFPGYRFREMQYMAYIGYRINWKDK
jgi:hypothetical protein